MNNKCLNAEERVYLKLKELYEAFGYKQYKMRKFEEYSLYAENKNFLQSEYVITFNDLSGKLLALKPDVTLSIVKNSSSKKSGTDKLYYKESVYRLDRSSKQFKEISQIGLELIGEVDGYPTVEALSLAIETLKSVGGEYSLDLSHMGVIKSILSEYGFTSCPDEIRNCIVSKNTHDTLKIAQEFKVDSSISERLNALLSCPTEPKKAIECAKKVVGKSGLEALNELEGLISQLDGEYSKKIKIDFSIVNDIDYYNGVVFQGYNEKFPKAILSGGRYDNLIKKFNSSLSAIGFALYLDDFSYHDAKNEYDADVLVLYSDSDKPKTVFETAKKYIESRKSVRVEKQIPENMSFKEIVEVGK